MESDFINELESYFKKKKEVIFAYLYGSYAKGKSSESSDIDVAVYLQDEGSKIEEKITHELEKILKKNVELLVLNRAKPLIGWMSIKRGVPIIIKDRRIWLDYFLEISWEGEDFLNFNLNTLEEKNVFK